MRHFYSTFLGIEHDLGVVSRVDTVGEDPLSVFQVGTFQQKLLVAESVVLIVDNDLPLQTVKVFVRRLNFNLAFDLS